MTSGIGPKQIYQNVKSGRKMKKPGRRELAVLFGDWRAREVGILTEEFVAISEVVPPVDDLELCFSQ
jgi:hypothetical protein